MTISIPEVAILVGAAFIVLGAITGNPAKMIGGLIGAIVLTVLYNTTALLN